MLYKRIFDETFMSYRFVSHVISPPALERWLKRVGASIPEGAYFSLHLSSAVISEDDREKTPKEGGALYRFSSQPWERVAAEVAEIIDRTWRDCNPESDQDISEYIRVEYPVGQWDCAIVYAFERPSQG